MLKFGPALCLSVTRESWVSHENEICEKQSGVQLDKRSATSNYSIPTIK